MPNIEFEQALFLDTLSRNYFAFQNIHRDLLIDGTGQRKKRPLQETQADRFATFFLMPKKQVIKSFQERFLTNKFTDIRHSNKPLPDWLLFVVICFHSLIY